MHWPWILGSGWYLAHFPGGLASRELLDRVVPDRPVFLPNKDGHDAWVNSRALEVAGITADTPDPHDGRIARNADGSPLGTLHEGAQDLVERHIPPTSDAELDRGLIESRPTCIAGHHELAGRHRRARWPRHVPAGGRPWPADGAGRGALW